MLLDLQKDQEIVLSVSSLELGFFGLAYGLEGTPGTVFTGNGCCAEHDSVGCKTPDIQQCVFAVDAFCCELGWDAQCIESVTQLGCGTCE